MELRFGYDFSGVRVHSDATAQRSAREVNAKAYAVGHNIVFGAGEFAPGTDGGRRLIAHELTHVLQQQMTSRCQAKGLGGESNEAAEREADEAASRLDRTAPLEITTVSDGLQRQPKTSDKASPPLKLVPKWTAAQLGLIQARLKWLGLYTLTVDREFGKDTESALVEAFGGDEWRTLDPPELIKRLQAAKRPTGKSGEHNLRYGEMFKDGLLDMTLGVGFQETGWARTIVEGAPGIPGVKSLLTKRGFTVDRTKAQQIYKSTGHQLGASAFGLYFVWNKSLAYQPPAGPERKVDVVVRLVANTDEKHGPEAAEAFKEGMKQSDASFYAGHGRVGSGLDFDPAMRIELLDKDGKSEGVFDDYEDFEEKLKVAEKTKDEGVLWERFQWKLKHNRVKVTGDNRGNVFINPKNPHPGEFLAKLMYWNLTRTGGTGADPVSPVTGTKGELAQPQPGNNYRLWVFNGCRTQDYVQSIRGTPTLDERSTDMLVTKRIIYWSDYTNSMIAFLDSVLQQQTAEQIVKEMDVTNVAEQPAGTKGGAVRAEGLSDNPVIPK